MKRAIVISLMLAGTALLISLVTWTRIPDPIPVRYGFGGQVDGYMSKIGGMLLIPAILFALPLLVFMITKLEPRREHVKRSLSAISTLIIGISGLLLVCHALILYTALNGTILPVREVIGLLGGLFVLIGLIMPKLRSNWLIGLRTPWTLSSERVWHLSHRLAGWTFIAAGIVTVITSFAAIKTGLICIVAMTAIGLAALAPIIYSYYCYKQEHHVQPVNP